MSNWKDIDGGTSILEIPQGIVSINYFVISKCEDNAWFTMLAPKHLFLSKEEAQRFVEGAFRVQIQRIANVLGGIVEWHPPVPLHIENPKVER